jgi:GDPmannose 4,6-dehydratase
MGNLNSLRDWGHAKDYVEAMWLMLQQDEPDDFVIATGVQHSIRELIELSFSQVGIEIEWAGEGISEVGINRLTQQPVIEIDPAYFRPTEVETLLGDSTKAKLKFGWEPKITFEELIKEMVVEDLKDAKRDAMNRREGFDVYQSAEEGR